MVEFVLFAVPVLVYVIAQARSPDRTWSAAWERVGASRGSARGYGWVLLPVLLVAVWGALVLVPYGARVRRCTKPKTSPALDIRPGYRPRFGGRLLWGGV